MLLMRSGITKTQLSRQKSIAQRRSRGGKGKYSQNVEKIEMPNL